VGAGGAFALSQPGVDRRAGSAFVGDLEARPWTTGFASRVGLRVEGGFMSQSLSSSGGPVSGDVQTVHAAALVSVAFAPAGRFTPYVIAGPAWGRPSTKLVVNATAEGMPSVSFAQTTHENVGGAVAGVGATWRVRAAAMRLEARWMSLATTDKSTAVAPVLLSVVVPLRR
jgi:opacity protein-like surface antigen